MLWHIVLQIKFDCHQFASIFVGVMALFGLRILEIHSFPHFSLTCFDTSSWHFAYYFFFLYFISSVSVDNLLQFLLELCPFFDLEYWKYTVFRTFFLHALTYWAGILHMTLFYCTTYQVWMSSISVNLCRSYAPFVLRILEIHSILHFPLTCFGIHVLSWKFTDDCFTVLQIKFECCQFVSIFLGVMPLLGLRILEIHSFWHCSPTCFDTWSWSFS